MSALQLTASNTELRAITSYLRTRGGAYFLEPNHAIPDVKLFGSQQRDQSRIYWFELKTRDQNRLLRVKLPVYPNGALNLEMSSQLEQRPRRFPLTELTEKFALEYEALLAIHNYFHDLNDPRFGTVRILDTFPDIRANVMEELREPSLRQLFARQNRLQLVWKGAKSDTAFANAGAWLRAYHSLAKPAEARHISRKEFIDSLRNVTVYLENKLADETFFRKLRTATTAAASAVLPESLPIGLSHGDFAMRNILVGPGGKVTVLDTLARWRTAIFEDIGYFLTNLKLTWPQMISQGLGYSAALIARYEHRFLDGYFGTDLVPIRAIRLYEIQALLDKWSSRVARSEKSSLANRTRLNSVQQSLENRYFKKSVDAFLRAVS